MLSAKLLNRIEHNWEQIATAVISSAHTDERVRHYSTLDNEELRARARDLVANLSLWLNGQADGETERRYEALGRTRHEQGFPLHEVIAKIQLIERKISDYVQEENAAQNAVALYSELEMLRALHRFFHIVQRSVVEGYETAAHNKSAWRLPKAS